MFNPFYPFTLPLLEAFVSRGKLFFVRQTFLRGKDPLDAGTKGHFLITPYDNFTTAQDHFGAIGHDPHRFFYHWNDPLQQEKMKTAAAGPEGYKLFASVFRTDWEKGITEKMREKIRRYVGLLGWTPGGNDLVETAYEVRFGELYICLRHKKREVKVKFEEIETLP